MRKVILVTKEQYDLYDDLLIPREKFTDVSLDKKNCKNLRFCSLPLTYEPPKGCEVIDWQNIPASSITMLSDFRSRYKELINA